MSETFFYIVAFNLVIVVFKWAAVLKYPFKTTWKSSTVGKTDTNVFLINQNN